MRSLSGLFLFFCHIPCLAKAKSRSVYTESHSVFNESTWLMFVIAFTNVCKVIICVYKSNNRSRPDYSDSHFPKMNSSNEAEMRMTEAAKLQTGGVR